MSQLSENDDIITEKFLCDILNANLDPPVTIKEFTSVIATNKGDNYLSIIYRIMIHLTNGQKYHWIIKMLPKNDRRICEWVEKNNLFHKEYENYNKWMKEMIELVQERTTTLIKPLWPKSYISDPNMLVMDDLKEQGFQMLSRQNQLDLEHTLVVIRSLARMHAYSIPLVDKYPKLKLTLGEVLFPLPKCPDIVSISTKQKNAILLCIDTVYTEFQHLSTNIRKLLDQVYELMVKLINTCNLHLVWCHSDPWLNNMLFKYNEKDNKVSECRFVDFQLSRICSPVIDLHYFIPTTVQHDVWVENEDYILKEYYNTFVNTCETINQPVTFTLKEFIQEFESKYFFGFYQSLNILPVVLVEENEINDFEFINDDENVNQFLPMFKHKRYRKVFPKILAYYEKKGLFSKPE